MNKVNADKEQLKELYEKSACTMLGYQLNELPLYIEELKEEGYLNDTFTVYQTNGKAVNETFELKGDNKFSNNLNIFIISLEDMKEVNRFAVSLRLERGYRWLDDIIDNSR